MANFTAAVTDLEQIGPVVDLSLAVPKAVEDKLKSLGEPVPPPISVAMMVDTGASGSVIQPAVAERLGLKPVGISSVVAVTTKAPTEVPLYAVRLLLPNGIVANVTAIGAELNGMSIQGLIGRDLLKYGVLVYIGGENQFTLSF